MTGEMTQSSTLSLANESQFLLISRESVRSLRKKLAEREEQSQTYTKDRTSTSDSIGKEKGGGVGRVGGGSFGGCVVLQ